MPDPSPFAPPPNHDVASSGTKPATTSLEGGRALKFAGDTGFYQAIKHRVGEYFERTGLSPHGGPRMYAKTALLFLWLGASYALLVFVATAWWQAALLSFSLGLAIAGIGFAVEHDGNHGAYSKRSTVNHLMGLTLDLLGASSYVWRWKHNVFHHTYPNLSGADDDIDFLPFARLAPAQPHYAIHRVQHFYMWALYGFLLPKWHFVDDFKSIVRGRIAHNRFPRPRGWDLVELLGGKAVFVAWAIVIPLWFHSWWMVLLLYTTTSLLVGCILAVVFQLAHCVEGAEFPEPRSGTTRMADAWAVHQTRTTVDFARTNRALTWYLGGLNFQIEHHLFPRTCHVHYPRIADIVERTCAEFGVRYTAHEGVLGAIASHGRWLRAMGQPPSAPTP